ncbi:MAG: type II toxin-antitoxin system VapC family toxin [bacterium]
MTDVLVDSCVILDVLTEDPTWFDWSASALEEHAESAVLIINPIIYSEVSVRFERIEELEEALPPDVFRRDPLPWEAGFLAGKCFLRYRKQGGVRRSPLPDFYVGAHAAVRGATLLTRDASRYRAYFPALKLIAPRQRLR